jgi:hypothetical protein
MLRGVIPAARNGLPEPSVVVRRPDTFWPRWMAMEGIRLAFPKAPPFSMGQRTRLVTRPSRRAYAGAYAYSDASMRPYATKCDKVAGGRGSLERHKRSAVDPVGDGLDDVSDILAGSFESGGGEIRTRERLSTSPVFKTGAIGRSATPPSCFQVIFVTSPL